MAYENPNVCKEIYLPYIYLGRNITRDEYRNFCGIDLNEIFDPSNGEIFKQDAKYYVVVKQTSFDNGYLIPKGIYPIIPASTEGDGLGDQILTWIVKHNSGVITINLFIGLSQDINGNVDISFNAEL